MKNKLKIKKDDEVIVLTGKYKGKRGTVLKAIPDERRVVVQGINMVKRHQRAGAEGAGGITEKEAPIHVSNVALVGKDGKPSRVGYQQLKDGTKVRVLKRSGETLN